MNGTNLLWLLVGVGLGLTMGWLVLRRQTVRQRSAPAPKLTSSESRQELLEKLRQTELAYHMAVEMSQFKGNFLARTAHELRSPLNGLIGMHQLILSDLCDGREEEREFIAHAHTCALKMIKVLSDVTEASKVEHGTSRVEIQPVQLAELFQNVYTLTHLQAQDRNLQLTIAAPDPQFHVLADSRRLQQALISLIDTTISHVTEGRIILSVQSAPDLTTIHIWIDQPISVETWSEPATALHVDSVINEGRSLDLLPASSSGEIKHTRAIAQQAAAAVPSPGFAFLVAQKLLDGMTGHLEIVPESSLSASSVAAPQTNLTRLQCTLPLTRLSSQA
ncbi:MAG: HAMP domain-containing histidine kinase [Leptolyngbyaceae cyanobacterium RU_5_1]|nr:HAMP domain-containing histidine kinase [Leptolyngbyaceae cyanobacterium RU_5_1]